MIVLLLFGRSRHHDH